MSFLSAVPLIGKIIEGVINLVDKAVLDKDYATKIKANLTRIAFTQDHDQWIKLIEEQSRIIQAEVSEFSPQGRTEKVIIRAPIQYSV